MTTTTSTVGVVRGGTEAGGQSHNTHSRSRKMEDADAGHTSSCPTGDSDDVDDDVDGYVSIRGSGSHSSSSSSSSGNSSSARKGRGKVAGSSRIHLPAKDGHSSDDVDEDNDHSNDGSHRMRQSKHNKEPCKAKSRIVRFLRRHPKAIAVTATWPQVTTKETILVRIIEVIDELACVLHVS